jgi:tetratricopeptide (TPR) repeat protein
MGDSPRIEALRRRVLADPASIAFAALAEEYRRAGRLADAIETARAGLDHHPTYASARVTLGRALFESGEIDQARHELEQALASAPENLTALRALADLYRSTDALTRARDLAARGAALAPQDREWRRLLEALEGRPPQRATTATIIPFDGAGTSQAPQSVQGPRDTARRKPQEVEAPPAADEPGLAFATALTSDLVPAPVAVSGEEAQAAAPPRVEGFRGGALGLDALQRWLDAIVLERQRRGATEESPSTPAHR